MANNLTAVISADTTRFTRAINEAQSVLSRYAREARTASGSISTCASVTDAQVHLIKDQLELCREYLTAL